MISRQPRQIEASRNIVSLDLEYDLVEDPKKLRSNISIFKLLKFPLILLKMLRSIADNSKKNDPLNKKSAENGIDKKKDVVNKRPPEDHNKKDTPDKTVGNLDKIISDTTVKNQ